MAEILVEDGATYPVSITVPEDGDARNAASVVVSFQALANRLAHFWTKFANALINGGTITPAGAVTIDLVAGGILNTKSGSVHIQNGSLQVDGPAFLGVNGNIQGVCFTANTAGCANRKTLELTGGSGDLATIDTTRYDTIIVSGITALSYVKLANPPATIGYHVKIMNLSTSQFVTMKNAADTPFGTSMRNQVGDIGGQELVYTASGWRVIASSPGGV